MSQPYGSRVGEAHPGGRSSHAYCGGGGGGGGYQQRAGFTKGMAAATTNKGLASTNGMAATAAVNTQFLFDLATVGETPTV